MTMDIIGYLLIFSERSNFLLIEHSFHVIQREKLSTCITSGFTKDQRRSARLNSFLRPPPPKKNTFFFQMGVPDDYIRSCHDSLLVIFKANRRLVIVIGNAGVVQHPLQQTHTFCWKKNKQKTNLSFMVSVSFV